MLDGFSPRKKSQGRGKGNRDVEEDCEFRKVGPRGPHVKSDV